MFLLGMLLDHEPLWSRDLSDETLLQDYWEKNNPEILLILLNRYEMLIQISFANFLTDDESALELANELYLHLHRKLKPGIQSFPGWLKTVIKNLQINRAERLKKRPQVHDVYAIMHPTLAHPSIEAEISWGTHLDRIRDILSPIQFDVLYEKYYWFKSVEEITKKFNLSNQKQTNNILYRAREKIRKSYPEAITDLRD